jgi:hypothetical protein
VAVSGVPRAACAPGEGAAVLHEFRVDLGDQERLALVLEASAGLYDPIELLEGEREAHRRLYSNLDAEQQAVYDELRAAGVLG